MLTDIVTYDKCRYLFDWLPPLDTFADGLAEVGTEMAARICLDAIGKQLRWYGRQLFSGSALIDAYSEDWRR